MAIINFNYSAAIGQAAKIDSVATEMQNMAGGLLHGVLDAIRANWRGEAAGLFAGRCESARGEALAQARALREIAENMRSAAKIIKEAEEAALARQRRARQAALARQEALAENSAGKIKI